MCVRERERERERQPCDSLVGQFLPPDCVSAGPLPILAGPCESIEAFSCFFCCHVCNELLDSSNSLRPISTGLTCTSNEPPCPP